MSLAKAAPERIRDKECERFALQERAPVPYVPEKDPVQETVSALKSDQSHKTTIREDAELHLPIWHCGTHEAFLMHASTAINAIKKQGTFKAYKEAQEDYDVEQPEVAKQAKAVISAAATSPSTRVLGLVAAALTTKVKNEGLSPGLVIYTCTAPFRSAYVTL
jgi:hypothetical protein